MSDGIYEAERAAKMRDNANDYLAECQISRERGAFDEDAENERAERELRAEQRLSARDQLPEVTEDEYRANYKRLLGEEPTDEQVRVALEARTHSQARQRKQRDEAQTHGKRVLDSVKNAEPLATLEQQNEVASIMADIQARLLKAVDVRALAELSLEAFGDSVANTARRIVSANYRIDHGRVGSPTRTFVHGVRMNFDAKIMAKHVNANLGGGYKWCPVDDLLLTHLGRVYSVRAGKREPRRRLRQAMRQLMYSECVTLPITFCVRGMHSMVDAQLSVSRPSRALDDIEDTDE